MKSASQNRRILRVSPALHREVKGLAALEGQTIESLADAILAEALARRSTTDEIRRAALSRPVPSQNRG